jgi:hypothetical protein
MSAWIDGIEVLRWDRSIVAAPTLSKSGASFHRNQRTTARCPR